MSPAVEDVARPALESGIAPVARGDFQPGEARPLAVDVLDDDAAVLVVRLRRDGAWIIDIVRFVATAHGWDDVGSSGGTYGDLPFELDSAATPEIAALTTGSSEWDDRALAYAGGFLTGPVDEVEVVTAVAERRIRTGINRCAFVVLAPNTTAPARIGLRFDRPEGPHVRAYARGNVVDDSAEWHRDREAALAGTVTVEQALAAPPGTVLTVRGLLLQLKDEAGVLCDQIDTSATPPRPVGPTVQLPGPRGPMSWRPDSPGVNVLQMVATGVVRDGVLVPPGE